MQRTACYALLGIAALLTTGCAGPPEDEARSLALVERFIEAANAHQYEVLDELLTPDFTRHSQATPEVQVRSREDMKSFLREDASVFPDGRVVLERTIVDGQRVAFQGTYTGTQKGPMGPLPPTGRTMALDVSGVFRTERGRIAELWIVWNDLAALAQLGHWPAVDNDPDATLEANKALGRVWFEDVINGRDLDAIDKHYAPDYVHHGAEGAELRGVPAARNFAAAILNASSDRVAVVEQQVAQGDLVVTRFTSRGTHTAAYRGIEPTGKEWVTEGICISRIDNGRIAEDWEIIHVSGL